MFKYELYQVFMDAIGEMDMTPNNGDAAGQDPSVGGYIALIVIAYVLICITVFLCVKAYKRYTDNENLDKYSDDSADKKDEEK